MVLADDAADPLTRRRRPRHPGRARPGLAGDPRDDERATWPTPSSARSRELLPRLERREILARALAAHGRIVLAPDLDAAIAFVDAYAPEHLSIDVRDADAVAGADPPRRLDLRRAAGRPNPPATTRPAPTTSSRPAVSRGPATRSASRRSADSRQIQRVDERGLASIRETVGRLATAEGLTAHRNAVEVALRGRPHGAAAMSPTPGHDQPADPARELQLGGDRRGGRRSLRRPDRRRSSGST